MNLESFPIKRAYAYHLDKVRDDLVMIEHVRVPHASLGDEGSTVCDHVALAVTKNGYVFVGTARCSPKDTYSRRKGFEMSVWRALRKVLGERDKSGPSFGLPLPLPKSPKELGQLVRSKVTL